MLTMSKQGKNFQFWTIPFILKLPRRTGLDISIIQNSVLWFPSFCLSQYNGSVCFRGAGDRKVRPRVLQRHLAFHHVRRASLRGPHPQTMHRHLPRAWDGRAGAWGRPVRQTDLPLSVTRDYDQMDQREDQMSLLGYWRTNRDPCPSWRCPYHKRSYRLWERNDLNARGPTAYYNVTDRWKSCRTVPKCPVRTLIWGYLKDMRSCQEDATDGIWL